MRLMQGASWSAIASRSPAVIYRYVHVCLTDVKSMIVCDAAELTHLCACAPSRSYAYMITDAPRPAMLHGITYGHMIIHD